MRILLADDQEKIRSALRFLLDQEKGLDVVAEVIDAQELVAQTEAVAPDLVLLDWELTGMEDGTLSALREIRPGLCVIALSGRPEAREAALRAGADVFVSKIGPPERLLATLKAAKERSRG